MSPLDDPTAATVLLVGDSQGILDALAAPLTDRGRFTVRTVATAEAAIAAIRADHVDCVGATHRLAETDGLALLELVRAESPTMPFLLLSEHEDIDLASRAVAADVTEFLTGDRLRREPDRVVSLIETAVDQAGTRRDVAPTTAECEAVLDAARDAILVVGEGRISWANQAATDLFDVSERSALLGERIADWAQRPTAGTRDGEPPLWDTDRAVGPTRLVLDRPSGSSRLVSVTAAPVTWRGERATTLVARDRTEAGVQTDTVSERAMAAAPIGVTVADARADDNPLVYVNRAFEQVTGYDASEVLGRNCRFLQGAKTDPEAVAALRTAIDDEASVTVELRNYRRDGTEFWNRVSIAPLRDDDGAVTHYLGFQEDVSERVHSKQELKRFRKAVESAGHAIFTTDADGTIEYVNDAFEMITGFDASEAVGESPTILKSGEMPETFYEELWERITAGEVWEEEIANARADGRVYYARQTIAPIMDGGGISGYVAIQSDITDKRQRQERLDHYRRAIESANDHIAAADSDNRLLFANEAYREFYGYEEDEFVGKHLADVLDSETWAAVESRNERALDGEMVEFRMTRERDDRPNRTFDVEYSPLYDGEEGVVGTLATLTDVTDLEERNRQIGVLDRLLRHNLRNDVNVITANAEQIAEEAAPVQRDRAQAIIDTAYGMLELANKEREIVQLIEDPAEREVLDLAGRLQQVVARFDRANPAASFAFEAPARASVNALPQIDEAFIELIDNACAYAGEAPTVSVTVTVDEFVEVRIADDGPGIPKSDRAILTAETLEEPLFHGSGLGLWLVTWLVTYSEGSVRIADEGAEGTTVVVSLPRATPE
jgi:PAS domain S-box-containing protein